MSQVDVLLSRLDKPRPNGKDRWRCACPVCGERNRSTLSVGIGDNGCVLVKCFKDGCGVDEIAAAVGLGVQDLMPPRESSGPPLKRRRMLTDRQALEMLDGVSTFLWTVGSDWVRGKAPDQATLDRVITGVAYIGALRDEAAQ